MKDKLKNVVYSLIGLAIIVGLFMVVGLFIRGGFWLSTKIYPWLVKISGITILVSIFILLPSAIFKKSRGFAAVGLLIASYIMGITLWVWAFILTYMLWGGIALIIGLCFMGVGVVPIAMLATAFNTEWAILGQLILLLVLTFGGRALSLYVAKSYENIRYELSSAS
jgi:hypothetical protein